MSGNTLYYGDNLEILRQYVKDESVDLIYLDPPFKSNQDYNILFKEQDGSRAAAQILAFEDTWEWGVEAEKAYLEVVGAGGKVSQAMQAFRTFLGPNNVLAYLAMMAPRLVELRRVLRPTGSLYLHCDPTASHYLKMLMDGVFGPSRFRSEVVWKRSSAHSDTKQGRRQHGRIHDALLFYTKSEDWTWNPVYLPYDETYVQETYRHVEPGTSRRYQLDNLTGPGGAAKGNPSYEVMGVTRHWRYSREKMQELIRRGRVVQTRPGAVPRYKRYLDEMPGVPLQDLWADLPPVSSRANERLGYPTQKPESLLERVIRASSNQGDTVLDPFCGCGTAIAAAQRLGRRWLGIDITYAAITVIRKRLEDSFGKAAEYEIIGEPTTISGAVELAKKDRFRFQWWVMGKLGGRPVDKNERKKGADQGIDGRLYFHDDPRGGNTKQTIISVKSGKVGVSDVRELRGVIEGEKAAIGVLVTLEEPTKPMITEAARAGFYVSDRWGRKYERLQILTVKDMLDGHEIDMPPRKLANVTYQKAPRAKSRQKEQQEMLFEQED